MENPQLLTTAKAKVGLSISFEEAPGTFAWKKMPTRPNEKEMSQAQGGVASASGKPSKTAN
jgi:hypothetical protein